MNVNLCFNDFFKGKFIDYEKVEFKKKIVFKQLFNVSYKVNYN